MGNSVLLLPLAPPGEVGGGGGGGRLAEPQSPAVPLGGGGGQLYGRLFVCEQPLG